MCRTVCTNSSGAGGSGGAWQGRWRREGAQKCADASPSSKTLGAFNVICYLFTQHWLTSTLIHSHEKDYISVMVIYAPFPFPQLCRPFRSGLTSAAKFPLISDSVKAVPAVKLKKQIPYYSGVPLIKSQMLPALNPVTRCQKDDSSDSPFIWVLYLRLWTRQSNKWLMITLSFQLIHFLIFFFLSVVLNCICSLSPRHQFY